MVTRKANVLGVAVFVCLSFLFAPLPDSLDVQAQGARQLPTEVDVPGLLADITILEGPASLVATGDFNGDGVDDFLVQYNVGGQIVPQKFGIIFGKRNQGQFIRIDLSTDAPDLTLNTTQGQDIVSLTKLGDLNGDGIDDLVLTQRLASQPGNPIFKVFLGSPALRPGVVNLDGLPANLTVISDNRPGLFATAFAGAADINGDGIKDLLLSENGTYPGFAVSVLFGPFPDGGAIDLRSQKPDLVIHADDTPNQRTYGIVVADINGDGIADVLLHRSEQNQTIGLTFQQLDVVFGSRDFKSGTEISVAYGQTDASIGGEPDFSVAATGDVNGDGIDDILVGITSYFGEPAPPPWLSGQVSIFFGSRSLHGAVNRPDAAIGGAPPPDGFQAGFPAPLGDHFGQSIAVRDINGDGIPDILVWAPGETITSKGRIAGFTRAYVILGSKSLASGDQISTGESQQDLTFRFDSKALHTTRGRVATGDFNGGGVADILIDDGGSVFVYFGGALAPPEVVKAKYSNRASQLTIFGAEFTGSAAIEINGVVASGQASFDSAKGTLLLQGTRSQLKLRTGRNEIVVISRGRRSNIVNLKL